jgi:putative FmdB family regulatory protein
MPTYDLQCSRCNLQFELFRQGFLRDEDRVCAGCGSPEVEQRWTGFVTARPVRGRQDPTVTGFGGHTCGAGCGCARARVGPRGEVIPP